MAGKKGDPATAKSALGGLLGLAGGSAAVATGTVYRLSEAYAERILGSFGLSLKLVDRSFDAVALNGLNIASALILRHAVLLVLLGLGCFLVWRLARPFLRKRFGGKPIERDIAIVLALAGGAALLIAAPLLGRYAAGLALVEIRASLSRCTTAHICDVYRTASDTIVGPMLIADKTRIFIATPTGARIVKIDAIVSTGAQIRVAPIRPDAPPAPTGDSPPVPPRPEATPTPAPQVRKTPASRPPRARPKPRARPAAEEPKPPYRDMPPPPPP